MTLIATDRFRIVIGLGLTGLACARHLAARGEPFAIADTREKPPLLERLRLELPDIPVHCGALDADLLCRADELVLSPGVALETPAIQAAVAAGVAVIGDIDLFCRELRRDGGTGTPIVAITGSNAKSTVTTLVGEMAEAAGLKVGVGGNLGVPVLELLAQGPHDLYVLELSSFQLETTHELGAEVATVLNVSPDHMDRYPDLPAYHHAKHRIFQGARQVVVNRDDLLSSPLLSAAVPCCGFGLGAPDLGDFGVREQQGESWLAKGLEPLMAVSELKIPGRHNIANALAALAIGDRVGLPMASMLRTLRAFQGLRHRCQWVAEKAGVTFINDSKGTNVGATLAAIEGLGPEARGRLILLAGGDGKGAEFSALAKPVATWVSAAVLFGRDRQRIAEALASHTDLHFADDLAAATQKAAQLASPGDIVLMSPACASFDMFSGFEARGDAFVRAVEGLPG